MIASSDFCIGLGLSSLVSLHSIMSISQKPKVLSNFHQMFEITNKQVSTHEIKCIRFEEVSEPSIRNRCNAMQRANSLTLTQIAT